MIKLLHYYENNNVIFLDIIFIMLLYKILHNLK